jgi:flagellin
MSVINTNISALQAQTSLRSNSMSLATSMERLSSGTRINSAKDDAAGLAISTRMTANIRGISAAIRNANDGISLTQTAEGSLTQISDNLQRIRELAVQSANTGNNASDRAAMNNEAKQLIAEIDRVASNTAFNGTKLLDGTFQNQALQVGAGNDSNDRISVSVGSAKSSALGVGSNSSYTTTVAGLSVGSTALAEGNLAINGFSVGAASADGVSYTDSDTSGIAVAAAINAISGSSAVYATVASTSTNTTLTGSTPTTFAGFAADELTINGVDVGVVAAGTDAASQGVLTAAAINAISDDTGVTAVAASSGALTLTAADGSDIEIAGTLAAATLTAVGLTAGTTSAGGTLTTITTLVGSAPTTNAGFAAGEVLINGEDIGIVAAGTDAASQGALTAFAINAVTADTGVTAVADETTGALTLTSNSETGITITGGITTTTATVDDTGLSSFTASAAETSITGDLPTTFAGFDAEELTINGVDIGFVAAGTDVASQGVLTAAAINLKTDDTGVTATADATTGVLTLVAESGKDIVIGGNLSAATLTDIGFTARSSTASFGYAVAIEDDAVRINGVNIGAISAASSAAERGGQMTAAINRVTGQTGVTASFSTSTGAVVLSAADGRNITTSINGSDTALTSGVTGLDHTAGGSTDGTYTDTTIRSLVSLSSTSSDGITISGLDADGLTASGFSGGLTEATATAGAGVSSIDLTTVSGSQDALTTLDSAINTITDSRASMGAYQNRLTASISNLETTSMNLSASRSRILDTDYAKETTNLAKAQIISQAATAMLAQANQSGQSVLALLK